MTTTELATCLNINLDGQGKLLTAVAEAGEAAA
jgi:hypothetical protein